MTCYSLNPGTYAIGDPAMFVKKTKEGDLWLKVLWDTFYRDMNRFQQLQIDGISFYITRTAEGDYYYQGIGTDTGTLMVIRINDVLDERFRFSNEQHGVKYFDCDHEVTVCVDRFNLHFSNDIHVITNSDDMI
ncbi:MAG: hypothetical protein C4537_03855 [Acholeplasma sp.]|jgi:hypothetical protein|nr:MAG: hypothetical protein C4537_03855 [Acholeplasma sp.]